MVSEGFTAAGEEGGGDPTKAAMVRFPRRNQNMDYHRQSLKLETVDESAENTSLWQVYVLGGIMVMRWIWARWRKRNDGGQEEDPSG